MITKRKSESLVSKSKEKTKTIKQIKNKKKEQVDKFHGNALKKNLKLHHEVHRINNENQNRMNIHEQDYAISQNHKNIQKAIPPDFQIQSHCIRKSASLGGLRPIRQIRKSLSPVINKDVKEKSDLKHKYSSKPTSRSEKQKNKETHFIEKIKPNIVKKSEQIPQKSKTMMVRKKSQKNIKQQNIRLKTESSTKIPQHKLHQKQLVSKQLKNKSKKIPKNKTQIKQQNIHKPKNKQSKLKQKIKNSIIFSDVSQHNTSPICSAIQTKQNFHIKLNQSMNNHQKKQINACIIIQKHFRGYLTRKYIQQLKYQIYCVIKIQKVWRGYICRKKLKKQICYKKNISIQNSLITIKDFSDEPKQQKLKNKTFQFRFQQTRSQNQSNGKQKINYQQQKYIQILQNLLHEQGLDQKFKQKIRKTLGKQNYVQKKIISEIISEKSFNSPRELKSPKSNLIINSPSSWSRCKQIQINTEYHCKSPSSHQVGQTLCKRINSPLQNKSLVSSSKKISAQKKQEQVIMVDVKPIQTSFQFIEQFQLRIVDYLRDNPQIKELFLIACQKCQHFNTNLILINWKKLKQNKNNDLTFFSMFNKPDIFPTPLRQQIIAESSMKIYLEDNNYHQSLWEMNNIQQQICQSYIKCIFDGLSQAVYQNYKNQVVTKKQKSSICYQEGHELFKIIFMNSLTLMQGWNEYMCGAQIPVNENDPNYKHYSDKNAERLDLMVKNQVSSYSQQYIKSWTFWGVLSLTETIFAELLTEIYNQFFI